MDSTTEEESSLITNVMGVLLWSRNASRPKIKISVIGRKSGQTISIPDPNVSRSKMTDVTYLLDQKSRKL